MAVLIGRQTMDLMGRRQSQSFNPARDLIAMGAASKEMHLEMVVALFRQVACLSNKEHCRHHQRIDPSKNMKFYSPYRM
jgi:hypothetical protein